VPAIVQAQHVAVTALLGPPRILGDNPHAHHKPIRRFFKPIAGQQRPHYGLYSKIARAADYPRIAQAKWRTKIFCGNAESFLLDVTKRDDCAAMARRVADKVGQVSILVNNAGIARRNGMLGAAEAVINDWEDIIAINLTGVFNVTHAFLEPLRAARGRIVNIGSIQSFVHLRTPSSPAYTASKHGVLGFTKALAAELGKDGVRVNAIGPGFIETPLNEKVRADNPALVKVFVDHTPLGRAGTAEDIVGPAIFLASDLSAYVSGSIVMVDGGYRTV